MSVWLHRPNNGIHVYSHLQNHIYKDQTVPGSMFIEGLKNGFLFIHPFDIIDAIPYVITGPISAYKRWKYYDTFQFVKMLDYVGRYWRDEHRDILINSPQYQRFLKDGVKCGSDCDNQRIIRSLMYQYGNSGHFASLKQGSNYQIDQVYSFSKIIQNIANDPKFKEDIMSVSASI